MAHTDDCPTVHVIGDLEHAGRQCFALVQQDRIVLIDPVTNIVESLNERGLDPARLDTVVATDLTVRLHGLAEVTAALSAPSLVGPRGLAAALSHEPGSPRPRQEGAGGEIAEIGDGETWEKDGLCLTASQHGQTEPLGVRASLGGHTVAYASNPDQAVRLTSAGQGADLLLVNLATNATTEDDGSSIEGLLARKDALDDARIMVINADPHIAAAATERGLECARDGMGIEL